MLSKLTIKNIALIESAEIEFGAGLNVLSGETGAGKSVILDSVNFVLGAKADRTMIRYGENECFVKAEFIVSENAKAVQILREMDIDSDGEIIISRRFSESGKNSVKINGNTVTVSMLRQVTDSLVDVHGQSEHFFLLKESNQLKTLDNVIGQELIPHKAFLRELVGNLKEIEEKIRLLGGDELERSRRLDLLEFQINEIQTVDMQENEEEELLVKKAKIVNLEKIITALHDAQNALNDENGIIEGLRIANRALLGISHLDSEYAELCNKLESLAEETREASNTIAGMADELYFDEDEASAIEERLDAIRDLTRKYGKNKEDVDAYLESIRKEHDLLSDCEGQFALLNQEKEKIQKKIYEVCLKITEIRKKRGLQFCERVVKELQSLNIPHAQFEIEFEPYTFEGIAKVNSNGLDNICFTFSANAGEPLKSLGKIISGGEMSRFMLAIKTQLSDLNEISTYIFDEIDAGISGKTAKVVGEKLAQIACSTQIIAVSHLAQIAVMSDREFLIEKIENNEKTITIVHSLAANAQKQEIVRLLGGNERDNFALLHAEELLQQAALYKKSLKNK